MNESDLEAPGLDADVGADEGGEPCQRSGACCAHFRVSFYWAEGPQRGLPAELTERVASHFSCMRGTNSAAPRCAALQGEIGSLVSCSLYEQRPSPCREVMPGDEKCLKARARHGLPALSVSVPGCC